MKQERERNGGEWRKERTKGVERAPDRERDRRKEGRKEGGRADNDPSERQFRAIYMESDGGRAKTSLGSGGDRVGDRGTRE